MKSRENDFIPPLSEICNLTDLEAISTLFQSVSIREEELNSELELALRKAEDSESVLSVLDHFPRDLKAVYSESSNLSITIESACNLARNVSKKVRDLDLVRARVKESISKVTDIIDITNCIEGVQRSKEKEDYEKAASYVQRFLNIDESVLEETSTRQLKSQTLELQNLVKTKLDDAIRNGNEKEILRFCCLLKPLGILEDGIIRYSHYLRNVCSAEAETLHKQLLRSLGRGRQIQEEGGGGGEQRITCNDALTSLFESVATLIENQFSMVEERFGVGSMVVVIKELQSQCDIHSTKILDLFMEHFKVINISNEIASMRRKTSETTSSKDPRELALLLDEIVLISQSGELFDRFIRRKAKEALNSKILTESVELGLLTDSMVVSPDIGSDTISKSSKTPGSRSQKTDVQNDGLLHISELNRKIQEIIGYYMSIEEYFMIESVHKAMRMDEYQTDSVTSSGVDHVFFIVQKSMQRALSTFNLNAVCATINIVITVLTRDFKEVFLRNLQEQLSRSFSSGTTLLGRSYEQPKVSYFTILNNFEVSSEYVMKLRKEIELEAIRIFNQVDAKMKSCLDDLVETSNSFKKVLQVNIEQMANSVSVRTRTMLEPFTVVNYVLTEIDFAEKEINDTFVHQFIASIDSLLKPFKLSFTPSNYDAFVHILVRSICVRLEQEVLKKKFNQLGSLQFDRELRILQNYFSTVTQKTVRDKFSRLSQIASLLVLEKASEVLEYWGPESAITWRLTPTEVRKVLALRIDFTPEAISSLKL